MKTTPSFARFIFTLTFTLGLSAISLQSATLVDWGGDYVSSYTGLDTPEPATGGGWITYNYSDTTPISPAGPTFYGAISLVDSSGTGTPAFTSDRFGIQDVAAGDQLRIGASAGATTLNMRGLIFFKKENFLDGGSTGTVNFSEGGSISLSTSTSVGANPRQFKAAVYALVGGEWNWYLSASTAATSIDISDPALSLWALYGIDASTAPLNAAPGGAAYTVSGSSFEDIGAIGFYFNFNQTDNNMAFFMTSFEVNATVIPEPSTAALLGIGALLLGFGRNYKRDSLHSKD